MTIRPSNTGPIILHNEMNIRTLHLLHHAPEDATVNRRVLEKFLEGSPPDAVLTLSQFPVRELEGEPIDPDDPVKPWRTDLTICWGNEKELETK